MTAREKKLTDKQIVRAATNAPELSERSFQLGSREFKVIDLDYDSYLKFLQYLQPLLEAAAGSITGYEKTAMSAGEIIKYAGASLPQIVQLICSMTDPDVTVEQVKQEIKSPFKMASIVLMQVEQNNVIADIADFFKQILPLLKAVQTAKS